MAKDKVVSRFMSVRQLREAAAGLQGDVSPERLSQLQTTLGQLERALEAGVLPRGAKSRVDVLLGARSVDVFLETAASGRWRVDPSLGALSVATEGVLRDCLRILGEAAGVADPRPEFDQERQQRYLDVVRSGVGLIEAAAAVGVSTAAVAAAVRANAGFAGARGEAQAEGRLARVPHGVYRYNALGCRCPECREEMSRVRRERRAAAAGGGVRGPVGGRRVERPVAPESGRREVVLPRVWRAQPDELAPVVDAGRQVALWRELAELAAHGPLVRGRLSLTDQDRARVLAMVGVVLDSGARTGELARMDVSDLGEGLASVRVTRRPQNGAHRPPVVEVCELREGTRVALRRWLGVRGAVVERTGRTSEGALWVTLTANAYSPTPGFRLSAEWVGKSYSRNVRVLNVLMTGSPGWLKPLPSSLEQLRRGVSPVVVG